ncbi:metal ABC transporter substrate-binding protein [Candidatus Solincola sp.]|nr:metal ABC transporter substrate-binding protein [Actinomycetota bacterium]MDI7252120.1 metal ABC transporter substrate-binding protein [Actinomycetota bacterium]
MAADIVPLAMICREVGGDHVEVEVLVPPGSSPHTYELSAGQVSFLAGADLLVINGLGLIPWAEDIHSRVGNPDLVVVEAAEAVPPEELLPARAEGSDSHGEEEEAGGHGHGIYDPHLWLDPVLALHIVDAVEEGLVRTGPEYAEYFRERASELRARMTSLHEEVLRRTAAFTHREFISFHSSWTYFARRYGLRQAGVIEELPGKEPSAGEIAALVELARGRGIKAVFAEEQFNPRVAEAVAEESEGEVRVWMLDPLGDLGDLERGDYCALIRYNLDIMEEALR